MCHHLWLTGLVVATNGGPHDRCLAALFTVQELSFMIMTET